MMQSLHTVLAAIMLMHFTSGLLKLVTYFHVHVVSCLLILYSGLLLMSRLFGYDKDTVYISVTMA